MSYADLYGHGGMFTSLLAWNTLCNFSMLSFRSAAIQIPVDITFFNRVLKFDKLKGTEKSWKIFILLNEHHLIPEVFISIE